MDCKNRKALSVILTFCCLFFLVSATYAIGGVTANCYGVIANQSSKAVTLKFTAEHGTFYTGDQNSPGVKCAPLTRNNYAGPLTCTLPPYPNGRLYFELSHKNKQSSSTIEFSTTGGSATTYIKAVACDGSQNQTDTISIPKVCAGGVCIFSNSANGIICDDPVPSTCF